MKTTTKPMKPKALRKLIGTKPDHFTGSKREWSKLIQSILIKPDHRNEKGEDEN